VVGYLSGMTHHRHKNQLYMMTTRDAAAYLRLKVSTIKGWRRTGEGPPFYRYSSRCVRYKRAELDAWIAQHSDPNTDSPSEAPADEG